MSDKCPKYFKCFHPVYVKLDNQAPGFDIWTLT